MIPLPGISEPFACVLQFLLSSQGDRLAEEQTDCCESSSISLRLLLSTFVPSFRGMRHLFCLFDPLFRVSSRRWKRTTRRRCESLRNWALTLMEAKPVSLSSSTESDFLVTTSLILGNSVCVAFSRRGLKLIIFAVWVFCSARNHEILASQAPKIRKNYVPPVAYGRMTYQYIKGAAPALPAPAPGTGASSHLLDDI